MTDPVSGGDSGWLVAAGVSIMGLIGGAITWLVGRKDRTETRKDRTEATRVAKLAAWHEELMARERLLNANQDAFQARIVRQLAEQDEKILGLENEVERHRIGTAVLFARVAHYDPEDPLLAQVSKLLGSAMPIIPGDLDHAMDDLLRQIP